MKSLAWMLLIFLAPPVRAEPISLTCEKGKCWSVPGYVVLGDNGKSGLEVNSSIKDWTCSVYGLNASRATDNQKPCKQTGEKPPEGVEHALIFKRGQERVVVPILLPAGKGGLDLAKARWVVLALCGLSFVLSGLVCLRSFRAAGAQAQQTKLLEERLSSLHRQLEDSDRRVTTQLQSAAPAPGPTPPLTRQLFTPKTKPHASFIVAVDEWLRVARTNEPAILNTLERIESDHLAPDEFKALADQIAESAVRFTDSRFPQRQNPELQRALEQVVAEAGLAFVNPQPNTHFDSRKHVSVETKKTSQGGLTARVAEVKRRGLERDGRVIVRAEVKQYS